MSKFLSARFENLEPYVPGEQPKDREYIKLNSNETSMPPSPEVLKVLKSERMNKLGFYTNPDATELIDALAERYNVDSDEVFIGNGSDEVLSMIFLAFFERPAKVAILDITYPFYRVFSKSFNVDAKVVPLKDNFEVDVDGLINSGCHIVVANPNAPTGLSLPLSEIERMIKSDPNRLVIVDEAYIDFDKDTESAISLIDKYDNLIVVHTMSKSRNIAGAHIGYAIACKELIKDLNGLRYAYNPYILSDLPVAVATAAVKDRAYNEKHVAQIIENREYFKVEMKKLGFFVMDTKTNFVFVSHKDISAVDYTRKLRERAILVRHYDKPRVDNFVRITIGTREEMEAVVRATVEILRSLKAA